eukprot:TRINITY_DN3984_c0_g3_i1.p1 TRINITY_DN3984_c0_g3~~TRINITY_DN3984_c0_g3_i1.p1  ORF type:complete len:154 (+),score=42.65 TRINITY_DN3984_c0_g3_i1:89-550(+)
MVSPFCPSSGINAEYGETSYIIPSKLTYKSSQEERREEFSTYIPASSFIFPTPINKQVFLSLLRSTCTITNARNFYSPSFSEAMEFVAKHFSVTLVDSKESEKKASFYGKTGDNHHVAFLIRADSPTLMATAIMSDSSNLSLALASELDNIKV